MAFDVPPHLKSFASCSRELRKKILSQEHDIRRKSKGEDLKRIESELREMEQLHEKLCASGW